MRINRLHFEDLRPADIVQQRRRCNGQQYRTRQSAHSSCATRSRAPEKSHLYGIDAIAIDPNDVNKLYMEGGAHFGGDAEDNAKKLAVFMSSQDQGRSFKQVTLPFSNGANEKGRQVGERLQVANFGNVLFFGTGNAAVNASNNGLDGKIDGVYGIYRSTDAGATWVRIDSPQGQYAKAGYETSTITGDPKVFGTVYLNKRGILAGTSSNLSRPNSTFWRHL